MKTMVWLWLIVLLSACTTMTIPEYVPDAHPYAKKYYATYDRTLTAAKQALEHYGWKIAKEVDPAVYELVDTDVKDRILLITHPRRISYGVGSHQTRLNVLLLAAKDNTTDVEFRFLSLNKVGFKQLRGYDDDRDIRKILKRLEDIIE